MVDSAFAVHSPLGPGLIGSVYEACLTHELYQRGLKTERQVTLPVVYRNLRVDAGLRLDMVVERSVVVELKAVETILPLHKAQLLTYLKLSGYRLGLLINFNIVLIKTEFTELSLDLLGAFASLCSARRGTIFKTTTEKKRVRASKTVQVGLTFLSQRFSAFLRAFVSWC